jgi:hypothetical protein
MMPQADTPWIGLFALLAMFVLPFLPRWLFEGPRTIKHHPRRHVCAECGAPWVDGHACPPGQGPSDETLHAELRRPSTTTALERRSRWLSETDD